MGPADTAESAAPVHTAQNRGWFLLGLVVAIYGLSLAGAQVWTSRLGVVPAPAEQAPFYRVQRDFIEGLCLAAGSGIAVTLGLAFWRRLAPFGWASTWLVLLFSASSVWRSFAITIEAGNVLDASLIPWPSLGHYLGDPLIKLGQLVFPALVVLGAWRTKTRAAPPRS